MKPFRPLLMIACFCIICALFSSVGSALEQDEAKVLVTWLSQTPYQGSSVIVHVTFLSNCSEELTIYYLGLHLDWMDSDHFVGHNLSDDPVIIPSYGSHTFYSITIYIPENAIVGTHNYFVGIDGVQGEYTSFSWDSQVLTLLIQNSMEEVYDELITKVASNITEAVNATYQSSEAQSLLEQAENAYGQALSLAAEENLEEAISTLQNASTYLKQADVEEQNYIETKSQQDPLLIIVGVAVVVIVTALIMALIVRRKKGSGFSSEDQDYVDTSNIFVPFTCNNFNVYF